VQATGVDAAMLIDVEANRTELLTEAPEAAVTVAPRVVEDVNEARAAGGSDLVVLSEQSAPEEIACQAINTLCDPPLRGGVGMSTALGTTLCTTGFNVYSATDLRAYVLTADHAQRALPDHRGRLLERGARRLPVQDRCQYRGTVCGEFVGAGRTHDNGTPGTGDDLHNLGVVRMEGCRGDSGGPIYIGNRGYGMTVRGSGYIEWIPSRPTGLGIFYNVPCYDLTWYEGLAGALELTNTRLRTG
jgi:hypothetical protein